jgi:hypothetical protein
VKDYANRSFVLLGVNCDKSKETLRQLTKQQKVTWRCWWDGRRGIGEQWQVDGYPALYLLDEKGIIREIFHGRLNPTKLDEAIARWVKLRETAP